MSLQSWPAGGLDRSLDTPSCSRLGGLGPDPAANLPEGPRQLVAELDRRQPSLPVTAAPFFLEGGLRGRGGGALSVPLRALPACSPPTLQPV